jgi:hypothetical protein
MSDLDAAFARADEARTAIASIIEQVRSGDIDLVAAFELADTQPLMGRCFAVKVFEAVPGIGKVRARRTMDTVGIDEDLWIRDVTVEDRAAVLQAFAS